jgi:hypothetical protein
VFECPVCAFVGLRYQPYAIWPPPDGLAITPPYIDWLGEATYEVCPMCEFEFGNDDDPGEGADPMSFDEYRADWESRGSPVARPTDVAHANANRETTERVTPSQPS